MISRSATVRLGSAPMILSRSVLRVWTSIITGRALSDSVWQSLCSLGHERLKGIFELFLTLPLRSARKARFGLPTQSQPYLE